MHLDLSRLVGLSLLLRQRRREYSTGLRARSSLRVLRVASGQRSAALRCASNRSTPPAPCRGYACDAATAAFGATILVCRSMPPIVLVRVDHPRAARALRIPMMAQMQPPKCAIAFALLLWQACASDPGAEVIAGLGSRAGQFVGADGWARTRRGLSASPGPAPGAVGSWYATSCLGPGHTARMTRKESGADVQLHGRGHDEKAFHSGDDRVGTCRLWRRRRGGGALIPPARCRPRSSPASASKRV